MMDQQGWWRLVLMTALVASAWQAAVTPAEVAGTAGPAAPTGNVQGLGLLQQQVGTTAAAGDVELSFSVSSPWRPDVALEAALVDDTFRPLAVGRYEPGERHVLVAKGVPAGTPLTAVFQAAASAPALDDVFDNSGYPFMNTISGNTPARFQQALALTKRRLLADPAGP